MKNRLQWLVDEYMSEMSNSEKETCEHQEYMKNLAMEIMAVEAIMKSDIANHVDLSGFKMIESKWDKALKMKHFKWLVFQRLEDEIQDAHMDLQVMELAKASGKTDIYTEMHTLAKQKIANSEKLNTIYISMPNTHGTSYEHKKWEEEYNKAIEKHKMNVAKIAEIY